MFSLSLYIELIFTFFFSLTALFFMRKFALNVGLVDKPNARKLHVGAVPLVGGLSICISILYFLFNHPDIIIHTELYAASILILVVIGALDDKYDIDFKLRFLVQGALSVAMMALGKIELSTAGNILGTGLILLGWIGYVVTIFAVVGAINAFNMVDGIDGLLGALSSVTFAGLAYLMYYYEQYDLAYFCLVLIIITIPYILLNLGAFGRKRRVFMGDAGSMLIGFTVIWLLLLSSQENRPLMRPVTALWLIAVPLMDMAAIMIRRIKRGDSPFKPDREHLHHIFQRVGFSSKSTLAIITVIAAAYAVIGILGEIYNIPEYIMFYLFIGCFIIYLIALMRVWVVTKILKDIVNKIKL
ncbi:UDP-N-acetylglucosamine--undecaprenyl-phosphate N-acetylglucosaminephosphotransferase [Vibrio breoganii]|uniref:UDP-N-acetylglucosamine--undecaprenyl-phosphate N-acetylglucosaminephosphotransferase n=1 Tax=Vibrio breoganii TaxID=553239 RepID=UPI000C832E57|nr:UDP-N-acetylglucosamine--undecaprenyl-phosphate N-acetylglucosaminephosphotransferase [Vibrio breoganii]PMG94680.1 undecaprenyl-phosphate alpha-N-acetylglucosaminyl 1-phosphate transferase [Vibrio breoganii]